MRALEFVRNGSWLGRERVVFYSWMIVLGFTLAVLVVAITSPELLGPRGYGKDFSGAWAAGTLALEGRAPQAYDAAALGAREQEVFHDPAAGYYAFFYPPVFMLCAVVVALLPYGLALPGWLGLTAAAWVTSMRRIWPERSTAIVPIAAAWPGVLINAIYGQNAFLSAALLGSGLAVLETRPLLAGMLLGALCYKPQLAVLLPIALLAGQRWRALAGMMLAAFTLCAASALAFGLDTWFAFLASTARARAALEHGEVNFFHMVTVFSAARMLGAGVTLAWAAQLATTLAVAGAVIAAWRSTAPAALKYAVLVCAVPLATPFALVYDLMIESLAVAWLAREGIRTGFLAWERALLVLFGLLPALSLQVAREAGVPVAPALELLLMAALLRRLRPHFARSDS